jgi:hypothetical protein
MIDFFVNFSVHLFLNTEDLIFLLKPEETHVSYGRTSSIKIT